MQPTHTERCRPNQGCLCAYLPIQGSCTRPGRQRKGTPESERTMFIQCRRRQELSLFGDVDQKLLSSASINHHLRDDDYQELLLSGGQLSMSLTRSPRNDEIASRFDPYPVFLDNGKECGFEKLQPDYYNASSHSLQ
jgi:hypothetical protein